MTCRPRWCQGWGHRLPLRSQQQVGPRPLCPETDHRQFQGRMSRRASLRLMHCNKADEVQ